MTHLTTAVSAWERWANGLPDHDRIIAEHKNRRSVITDAKTLGYEIVPRFNTRNRSVASHYLANDAHDAIGDTHSSVKKESPLLDW